MNAEYKRDLQNNYLILEAPLGADAEDYRLKMAEQNRIPGLLALHSARKDGTLYLHYEITSMQPIENVFEKRTMGYDDILLLLTGIRDALEAMQKFLLDPAQLVFDPDYLYVDPDGCRVRLCYLPGSEGEFPITMLAEFILKRLDHKEQQAVVFGYTFYQKATEENFSLQRTLRELLAAEEEAKKPAFPGNLPPGDRKGMAIGNPEHDKSRDTGGRREHSRDASAGVKKRYGRTSSIVGRKEYSGSAAADAWREYDETSWDFLPEDQENISPEIRESYGVTRRERKRRPGKRLVKLFDYIHPAVLLSTLALLALLEIAFYLDMLSLTEAGGIFFLLISVEVMGNKFWRNSKEKKGRSRWVVEEDDEMYRMLQEEMYEMPETGAGRGERERLASGSDSGIGETRCLASGTDGGIGETRCLVPGAQQSDICLVCTYSGADGIAGQDIFIGAASVYIGKIQGESDVILDSPTVSRRHARLEYRDGVCYVKDLNSRNGTFCNGKKLKPQEQCRFEQGDEISFAEVCYRAVLRRDS